MPFITLSRTHPRAWVTLSGCNFRCRGCFSIARERVGSPMHPKEVSALVSKACHRFHGSPPEEVVLTGGEPTLDGRFLLDLAGSLETDRLTLATNGSLLGPDLLEGLIDLGLAQLMIDLKALDEELHLWYTGRTNREVLANIDRCVGRVPVIVNTLYIPGIVDLGEVGKMADYLAALQGDLELRVNPYRSELARGDLSREPTVEEMDRADRLARGYLRNGGVSRSCLRESEGTSSSWITVFPDGTHEIRGVNHSYREENRRRFRRSPPG
ncbi:MAG: radical SAM protein [Methanomassiliicoccales archaeon]